MEAHKSIYVIGGEDGRGGREGGKEGEGREGVREGDKEWEGRRDGGKGGIHQTIPTVSPIQSC